MTIHFRGRRKTLKNSFGLFLISACACALAASFLFSPAHDSSAGAQQKGGERRDATQPSQYGKPVRLADLEDSSIGESSGIVASRRHPGLFWTHNDSGGGPFLYAFDRAGRKRGVWKVVDAEARDWEDIAAGPGPRAGQTYLYIGDIGDNFGRRETVTVYRVPEPLINPAAISSTKKNNPLTTEPAEAIRLTYPDGKHDAEALMVHPATGDLYIITKKAFGVSGVYKAAAPLVASKVITMSRVAEVRVPGLFAVVTAGDISPDGTRVVISDYQRAYEISLPAKPKVAFDEVWKQPLTAIETGSRQQGEAVCYRLDGKAILLTSEKRPAPLIEITRH